MRSGMNRLVCVLLLAGAGACGGGAGDDDGTTVDARPPGPIGEVCDRAEPIVLPGGVGSTTIRDTTKSFANNYDIHGCFALSDFHTVGPDRVYVVNVPARHRLIATADLVEDAYYPLVSLIDGPPAACTAEPACAAGYPTINDGDLTERALHRNTGTSAADIYVVVDGYQEEAGEFTLYVVVEPLPATGQGDTCEQAEPVVFTSGRATLNGNVSYLAGYWDDYRPRCPTQAEVGNDRAYKVTMAAGERIDVTFTRLSQWFGTVYILSGQAGSCGNATCLSGVTSTPRRATYDNATGAPQDVFVVVDGYAPGDTDAPYQLDLRLGPPPPGETCAAAEVVDVSSGSASVVGTTLGYRNDLAPACSGFGAVAGDHFYVLTVPAQRTLTATVTPQTLHTPFDLGLYLIAAPATNCTSAATCLAANNTSGAGQIETMTYANKGNTPIDVFLAVDGGTVSQQGGYLLSLTVAP